ncbi:unnamed protein product [Paramecium sonneborni]|uniref:WD40-repeat-containing domain n=1 Tax=Paramecium sonneborni TaxID=65129 RepID=A0A8S1RN31_9CILI|nr:unnamed protein product [Paramecium sonneborni]
MNNFKQQGIKQKIAQNDLDANISSFQFQGLFANVQKYKFQNQEKQLSMINQEKKLFQYSLIAKSTKKQEENCYAIEINQDMTLIIFGCNNKIKVNSFDSGNFKEIQTLEGHTDNVTTLNFLNELNNIISGSDDKQIIIWQQNQQQLWGILQILEGHSGQINCVLINYSHNLIISCSWDKTIKFWIKQNNWKCYQTISEHTSAVFQLSLNDAQNKLISCGIDQFILVMEYSNNDQQWIIIKKIWTSLQGNRLCFLNDNIFAFQPDNKEIIQIYEINNTKKLYEKKNEIAVQGSYDGSVLFPQKFIKEKSILVNKYYKFINLIKLDHNGQLLQKFTIEFSTYGIFGTMSSNGEYLITWNYKTKEIELRKLND